VHREGVGEKRGKKTRRNAPWGIGGPAVAVEGGIGWDNSPILRGFLCGDSEERKKLTAEGEAAQANIRRKRSDFGGY